MTLSVYTGNMYLFLEYPVLFQHPSDKKGWSRYRKENSEKGNQTTGTVSVQNQIK